jgi:F0F1-type ATP synthase gamma subunit
MKPPELTLHEWVNDRVHFYCWNSKGKEFWTREEMNILATLLRTDKNWEIRSFEQTLKGVLDAVSEDERKSFQQALVEGKQFTGQYLAQFDSWAAFVAHCVDKRWLKVPSAS